MADARPPAGVSWAHAAEALAARVNRRDRRSVVLWRVGLALLTAAGAALLWRALGPATWGPLSNTATVSLLLLLGLLGGLLLAWRASHRATPVAPPDAAWALDRVARAEGRGLAAAAATGPAASEAAFAGAPLGAPPVIRLLPPRGLVPLAAGVLLGVLALLAPAVRGDAEPTTAGGPPPAGAAQAATGAAPRAAAAEREAAALDRRRETARAVRMALNLPPEGPLDPSEVARALADPRARAAAAKAAGADPALAGSADPSGPGLAGLLDPGEDNPSRAEARRRDAAGARGRAVGPVVPAGRRDLVDRYLQRID